MFPNGAHKMRTRILVIALLVSFGLSGCGGGTSKPYLFEGTWVGKWVDTLTPEMASPLTITIQANHQATLYASQGASFGVNGAGSVSDDGVIEMTIGGPNPPLNEPSPTLRGHFYVNSDGEKMTGEVTA